MENLSNKLSQSKAFFSIMALITLVMPAQVQANIDSALYDCLIEPNVVASVGSPVQGVLAEALVDRGDFVKKGQPIARLEAISEIADLEYARARAAMASEMSAREADLRLAKVNLNRQAQLKKQGLKTAQKYD